MIIDAQHHLYKKDSPPIEMRERLKWMDQFGINLAVITNQLPVSSTDKLAVIQSNNDKLATMEKEHPDRFVACPTIPINERKAALEELDRVVSKYEPRAVFIQPYEWRIEHEYLHPFYEKLNELRMPVFIHPLFDDLSYDKAYGLVGMGAAVGFPFNETLVLSRLLLSGLLDSFPRLKFVTTHLGGALPFLIGRVEAIHYPGETPAKRPPREYLDHFHFDIVCYAKEALEFAVSVFGPQRFVFGTDYACPGKGLVRPQQMKDFVEGLPIGSEAKEGIYGKNLADLLKIKVVAK